MPRNLYIFDVSPFIHAGAVNKYSYLSDTVDKGSTWVTLSTPTGGTSLIFNSLYNIMGHGDIVMCCDRNPTIKKAMLDGYKGSRDHKRNIEVEKAAAEYILQQCGFTVLARDGYEADDIIYSLVKKLHDNYDHIYIYTGDSDLYFLVDDIVSIRPSSSRAKEVTRENYETTAQKDGCVYNTLTLKKIIFGDTSDEIPGIPKERRQEVWNYLSQPFFAEKLGCKEIVKALFDINYPEYSYNVDIVFPLFIDDLPDDFNTPDRQTILNFGDAINNKMFRGRGSRDFDVSVHVQELHNRGAYLEVDE